MFQTLDLYEYHREMFLHYNNRLVNRTWRNAAEEELVRNSELYHAEMAAEIMPQTDFKIDQAGLQTVIPDTG